MLRQAARGALLAGLLALAFSVTAAANGLPNARLGRGISIHEAMNWPEMTPGATPAYKWPPFASPRQALQSADLRRLKAAGFDTIRLTVGPGIFLSTDGERRKELDALLLDRVSRLIAAGFTVIVDFHPIGQDPRFLPIAFTRGPDQPLVKAYRALLVRTAVLLATLPKEKVVLEFVNEPQTREWSASEAELWRVTQKNYFSSVRTVAPDLTVMVTGCCSCCGSEIMNMDPLDYPGNNVYFTFHFYSPHAFTHQGVHTDARPLQPTRFLTGVPFPLNPDDIETADRRARDALARVAPPDMMSRLHAIHDMDVAIRQLQKFPTPEAIATQFDAIAAWGKANGIAPQRIFLGEFGIMRPNVDSASRHRWIQSVRIAAERRGMPWAYWSFDGPEYMGLILDRQRRDFDPLILDALGLSHDQNIVHSKKLN